MGLLHDMMMGSGGGNPPSILGAATSSTNNLVTSHQISLPSGIQAGELLIAVLGNSGDRTHTWPAGWTEIADALNGTIASATIAYRVANGSDGASVTVTSSTATLTAHCAVRVGGNWKTPTISASVIGTSTSPNSGSVTASVSSAEYLFMSVASGRLNAALSGATSPTNYTTRVNSSSSFAFALIADRVLTNNSDDPGAWSLTTSTNPNWLAWTIVV